MNYEIHPFLITKFGFGKYDAVIKTNPTVIFDCMGNLVYLNEKKHKALFTALWALHPEFPLYCCEQLLEHLR